MTVKHQTRPRRFAVIGAGGAAGLATLKIFLEELYGHVQAGDCEIVGFEQRDDVGGVWLPDSRAPSSTKRPETPIYDSLTTNVAHPIMLYPSHLAAPSTPLFTKPQVVSDYMQSYVDRFNLRQYIRFNSRVVTATWDSSICQWKVVHRYIGLNVGDRQIESISYFDHLLIANGHYHHPFVPEIDGLQAWASSESRNHTHSMWYRNPEPYRNRSVLVIGGGHSGVDISNELSLVTKKTVHSVRSLGDQDFEHILQPGEISHFSSDGFVNFKNGKREYVDRIIFATGYQYDCSFLTQLPVHEPQATSDHLYNSGFHIYPLALHMFPLRAAFPPTSLAFIGLPMRALAFPLFEVQATLAVRQMAGQVSLDFNHELSQTVKRNDELGRQCTSAIEVARRTHRFDPSGGFYDYYDLLWRKARDSRRTPEWRRELAPDSHLMRPEWQELERLGLAESWVKEVRKGGIEEWVELMRKVVNRAKDRQRREMALSIV